jgi:hypothetical protein
MQRLGVLDQIVPVVRGIISGSQVGLGVSLLRVVDMDELDRISNEENRRVETNHVPVTPVGLVLDSETSGVSSSVGRASLTTNGRKSHGGGAFVANLLEGLGVCDVGDVIGHLKVAMGSSSVGMDDSLGDSLSVEMGQSVNQIGVLEQQRAGRAGPLR